MPAPQAFGSSSQRTHAAAAAQAPELARTMVSLYTRLLESVGPMGSGGSDAPQFCQITPRDLSALVRGLTR